MDVALSRLDQSVGRLRSVLITHPLLSVFIIALIVRVLAAGATHVIGEGLVFLDDRTYWRLATDLATGRASAWGPGEWAFVRTVAAFVYPLAGVYALTTPNVFVGQCFVALLGASTAVLTTRLAREVLPTRHAVFAGLAVALLPSQVLWSALILKDPLVWTAVGALAVAMALSARIGSRVLLFIGIIAVASLAVLAYSRQHSLLVVSWAAGISAWVGVSGRRRLVRGLGTLVMVLAVPLVLGLGPAAVDVLIQAPATPAEIRTYGAEGARTAVVDDGPPSYQGPTPATEYGDPAPEQGPTPRGGLREEVAYLPRGLSVMLLEPYPWQDVSTGGQVFAKFEMLLWYPLLLLAVIGVASVRRRPQVLAFPLLVGGATVLVYALAEGNFGTAYRHRGEFVWVVALFAAFGTHRLSEARLQRMNEK